MANQSWKKAFQPGIESLRASWPPMLLVQIVCVATVIGYFNFQPAYDFLVAASDFKDRTGLLFVLGSGFIAGGLLPEIAKILVGRIPKFDRAWLSLTAYTSCVYMALAALVFYMFKFQVVLFGDSGDFVSVTKKVIFDQFIFSPFVSIPLGVGLFKWRQANFKLSAWKQVTTKAGYKENVFPALVMCWSYWGPIVCGMYWLPERIQFVVSAFCQAAWSLLFVFMVESKKPDLAPPE
ncbi:MAG: hypothetical protein KF836_12430 [Fimbriimonadaceae bacterium]|nr:hypothetical protein [Fimbriimonadaceae bacterium]